MSNLTCNEGLRILIVDDDMVDREMVRRLLSKSPHNLEVEEASNVDEGLLLYDRKRYDIVLLDYRMPRRDGIEMIIELRTHMRNFGSAIVMMSSAEDEKLVTKCLEAGAQDFIPKSEITSRRLSNALVHAKTRFKLETELRNSYLKSKDLAEKDSLTGLANRFVFEESLQVAVANNARSEYKLGLILFDMDNFKAVNDIHGHDVGDLVLKKVAICVSNCLREEELFARLGGDEFAILISNLKDAYQLNAIANRILTALKEPVTITHISFNVEISMGVSIHPDNSHSSKDLIKCSDIAMYRAKLKKGSSISYFYSGMQDEFLRRYVVESVLADAIKNNLLSLYYQPIFNPLENSVSGTEALLRLRLPTGEMVFPDEFIPIAEQTGFIIDIGEWVIETALKQLKQWGDIHLSNLVMSINLSSVQLESDNIIDTIKSCIGKNNVDPGSIEFEITETAYLSSNKIISERIHSIHNLGCRIALDDFGTGYSSISHLLHFPITTVKIDKSILPSGPEDKSTSKLLEALVILATSLGLDIVAEGVENEFQLSVIKCHNLKRAQGYYFKKPGSAHNIEKTYFL